MCIDPFTLVLDREISTSIPRFFDHHRQFLWLYPVCERRLPTFGIVLFPDCDIIFLFLPKAFVFSFVYLASPEECTSPDENHRLSTMPLRPQSAGTSRIKCGYPTAITHSSVLSVVAFQGNGVTIEIVGIGMRMAI